MNEQPKLNEVTICIGYTFDKQYFEVGKIIGEDELMQQSNSSFTTSLIRAASYIREFGETSLSLTQEVLFEIQTTGKYFVDGRDTESKENIIYGEYEKSIIDFLCQALELKY